MESRKRGKEKNKFINCTAWSAAWVEREIEYTVPGIEVVGLIVNSLWSWSCRVVSAQLICCWLRAAGAGDDDWGVYCWRIGCNKDKARLLLRAVQ